MRYLMLLTSSVRCCGNVADAKMSVGPGHGCDPGKMVDRRSRLSGAAMAASN
jgi:hypothetical protein